VISCCFSVISGCSALLFKSLGANQTSGSCVLLLGDSGVRALWFLDLPLPLSLGLDGVSMLISAALLLIAFRRSERRGTLRDCSLPELEASPAALKPSDSSASQ
jgi:hypothetical protein